MTARAHQLLLRTQTLRDWRVDVKCSCGQWERFDLYDLPAARRVFDAHIDSLKAAARD